MKRVLFVDDEQQILDGLHDSMRSQRHDWQMSFATSGERALALVEAEPFDVVVSDMRMPGMDGATLLERVRDLRPDTVRVVLSGYADVEAAVRAAGVAHLSLTKPCPPDALRATIIRACSLQALVGAESMRRAASGVSALPSAPDTFLALQQLALDPDATAAAAAAIVERDIAMSAKVLQLVNSAFFGLGRRINSIDEAVRYLGFAMLKALVAAEGAFTAFTPARAVAGFEIESLQRHSTLAARIARRLLPDRELAEAAFTAGMLHDVGQLVLAAHWPDELQHALAEAEATGLPLHEVEQAHHGAGHAELGAYVLGLWGLPHAVVEAVARHHQPDRAQPDELDIVVAVHVADHLAHVVVPLTEGGVVPPLDEAMLGRLGLLGRLDEWRALATELA